MPQERTTITNFGVRISPYQNGVMNGHFRTSEKGTMVQASYGMQNIPSKKLEEQGVEQSEKAYLDVMLFFKPNHDVSGLSGGDIVSVDGGFQLAAYGGKAQAKVYVEEFTGLGLARKPSATASASKSIKKSIKKADEDIPF